MLPELHFHWVFWFLVTPTLQGLWRRASFLCFYSATHSKAHFMTWTSGGHRPLLQTTAKHHCGKSSCLCQHNFPCCRKERNPSDPSSHTCLLQLLLAKQCLLDLEAVSSRGHKRQVSHPLNPVKQPTSSFFLI